MKPEKKDSLALNILIINPFGIGDVLFTTPAIASLKDHFQDSVITYWCNERVKGIFKDNPNVDHCIAGTRGDLKRLWKQSKMRAIKQFIHILREVKKGKFDMVFDFSLDHRYGLLTKLLGIKRRIGFNYKKRGRFLTDALTIEGYHASHVVEHYLELLKFVGVTPARHNLELFVSGPSAIKSKIVLESMGVVNDDLVIGIAPAAGASWGKDAGLKHWPAIRFAQLADRIIREWGAKIILIGDKSERLIADALLCAMKNKAIDLVGKTAIDEIPALLSNCALLIANDGGLLHMAVALGVPTVSIFGPVSDTVYGPYPPSEKHKVIKKELACQPCYVGFKLKACMQDKECINAITTEQVFQAVNLVLQKGGSGHGAKDPDIRPQKADFLNQKRD